ncbi:MAG TPA: hypothetical protein VFH88_04150 [Candidatus Krumholzibacteria bacterium]|nr:hypothetical protein [Candidatus Krumholzibacteria bacterium]
MKYLLWPLLILLVPTIAMALEGGILGVYADQTADCLVFDTPGVKTLYVINRFSTGSTKSQFRIEFSPGFTGSIVSYAASAGSVSGDPLTGLNVNYGSCLAGEIEVLQVQVMLTGTSAECSWVRIMPVATSVDGDVDTYDCVSARHAAMWAGTHIQHTFPPFCPDLAGSGGHTSYYGCQPTDEPLAVNTSTWGMVKSLYR